MSFYLTDTKISKLELRTIIEIIASCTDLNEVYYDSEDEERVLLRKIFKDKFLPKEDSNE